MLKKLFIICCVVITLTGCPEMVGTLMIINQSDEVIFWIERSERTGEWYEIPSIESYFRGNFDRNVLSVGGIHRELLPGGFQSTAERGWIKYTFFNYDSIKTIPWQRICDERIILKEVRFDSWEDFERCNLTITYP